MDVVGSFDDANSSIEGPAVFKQQDQLAIDIRNGREHIKVANERPIDAGGFAAFEAREQVIHRGPALLIQEEIPRAR